MKPTISEHKRQQSEQIRRDTEAWKAKGNRIKQLPPAGENTDPKVSIKDKPY